MDSYLVGLDALTLAWAFIYTNYMCDNAVNILAILSTGAFEQWLIKYSNVWKYNELANFFTKQLFSYAM